MTAEELGLKHIVSGLEHFPPRDRTRFHQAIGGLVAIFRDCGQSKDPDVVQGLALVKKGFKILAVRMIGALVSSGIEAKIATFEDILQRKYPGTVAEYKRANEVVGR